MPPQDTPFKWYKNRKYVFQRPNSIQKNIFKIKIIEIDSLLKEQWEKMYACLIILYMHYANMQPLQYGIISI